MSEDIQVVLSRDHAVVQGPIFYIQPLRELRVGILRKGRHHLAWQIISQFDRLGQARIAAVTGLAVTCHPLAVGHIMVEAVRLHQAFDAWVLQPQGR